MLRSAIADDEFEVSVAVLRRADEPGKRFPVVYVPDANFWFAMVVVPAFSMMLGEELCEMIVVGIGHPVGPVWINPAATQKYLEVRTKYLTPTEVEERGGGGAEKFLGFIRDELIRFVDSNYPTNPEDRTLLGDSFGGLFSLYALFQHPETFNRYVAGSPSLWSDDGVIFQHEREFAESHSVLPVKLFTSVESLEDERMVTDVQQLAGTLKGRNYTGLELTYVIFDDETHYSVLGQTVSRGLRTVFSGF